MKKISLLVCTVFASVTLFAGTAVQNKAVKTNFTISKANAPQAELVTERKVGSFNLGKLRKATNAIETDTMYAWYQVPNQFVAGSLEEGFLYTDGQYFYFSNPQIVTPFAQKVPFVNRYSIMTPAWEVSGAENVTGQQYIFVDAGDYGGEYILPTLSYDPDILPLSDTTQIYFGPYTFGKRFSENMGADNSLYLAPQYLSVTQAGYYTEYPTVISSTLFDGWGWIWMGGSSLGAYSYGTKVINPWIAPTQETINTTSPYTGNDTSVTVNNYTYFDSIVTIIENPTTMYIEHITVDIWTASDDDVFFPDSANDIITMTILPLINDSTIDWDNPIATTTAGKADFLPSIQTWWGSLDFKFYEEDPVAHTKKQVPLVMDSAFVVVLSGLSQNSTDLGFLTDYYDDAPSANERTFFVDYSEGERALESVWRYPANLLINFHSVWPSIQGIPEEIEVPLEGAEITVTLPTNVWADNLEIESDDWIEIEATSQTEGEGSEEEFLYAIDVTLNVEESDNDREGLIEINALGKIYEVVVKQTADAPSAIENAVKVVNDGKLYNVLGIEVDEDYKGVVIRNGEKFLQR